MCIQIERKMLYDLRFELAQALVLEMINEIECRREMIINNRLALVQATGITSLLPLHIRPSLASHMPHLMKVLISENRGPKSKTIKQS